MNHKWIIHLVGRSAEADNILSLYFHEANEAETNDYSVLNITFATERSEARKFQDFSYAEGVAGDIRSVLQDQGVVVFSCTVIPAEE